MVSYSTRSEMLGTGVDRIVEQVVNPKMFKVFKPQIDKVVCEALGLDYEAWLAEQRRREQWFEQERMRQQQLQYQQQQEQYNQNMAPPNMQGINRG